jgi:hypothetical protein
MKLVMYLGNDFIEAVPVENERVRIPGYLGNFKRDLKVRHKELIKASSEEAEFLVVEIDKNERIAKAS